MLKFGPPVSGALLSRSSRGEDPPAASDWRKRAVGFLPLGSSLRDLVGGGASVWERCFGDLGNSLACGWGPGGNSLSGQEPSRPRGGMGWGQFSGQNLQGQRPQEARAVGDLAPLQSRFLRQEPSSDPLIAAAATVGRHTLRTADWGRFFAPQVSSPIGYRELLTTMKGGAPGKGLALTPHSPAPHLPPQAAAWDPPGTPRSRRFPHGLAGGLQVRVYPASVP